MQETEYINVYGARVHNLKDIDAEIPRNSLTVITGLSGSVNLPWLSIRYLRGTAPLYRDFFGLCPQLFGESGTSGCR